MRASRHTRRRPSRCRSQESGEAAGSSSGTESIAGCGSPAAMYRPMARAAACRPISSPSTASPLASASSIAAAIAARASPSMRRINRWTWTRMSDRAACSASLRTWSARCPLMSGAPPSCSGSPSREPPRATAPHIGHTRLEPCVRPLLHDVVFCRVRGSSPLHELARAQRTRVASDSPCGTSRDCVPRSAS